MLARVCFVAGTQVVVGVKVEEEDGRIVELSAGELARRQATEGEFGASGGAVATALKIVGYVTAAIEDLVARGGGEMGSGSGQSVIARDQHDPAGPLAACRISRTYRRTAHSLQVLRLRDELGHEQTLRVTEVHPFHLATGGDAWVSAKSLAAGDTILGGDGTLSVVSNEPEAHPAGVTVYNLEVEDAHTYFVLAADAPAETEAVWVHNADYVTNPNGQVGRLDHRRTIGRLVRQAREEFPEGIIHEGTSIRQITGVNRRPDVWVEDPVTGDVLKVYEAARQNGSGFVPRERLKLEEYSGAGIDYHFEPVKYHG